MRDLLLSNFLSFSQKAACAEAADAKPADASAGGGKATGSEAAGGEAVFSKTDSSAVVKVHDGEAAPAGAAGV